MNQEIFQQVKEVIMQNPRQFESLLQILHIARHLERIADHATNIAEDLIYLIEGRIIRHQQVPGSGDGTKEINDILMTGALSPGNVAAK